MVRFVRWCLKATAMGAAILPRTALAGWGDENWGEMVWGPTLSVPTLGLLGLSILVLALASAAAWGLRRRAWGMSVLLVVLAIPLAVAAGTITVPHTFVNGEPANAGEVNANFDAVETAVNDHDARIGTAQATADAAQVGIAGSCAAGSSIRAIAADGTVTCEVDTDTNTTYIAGSGLGLGGTTFAVNPTEVQSRVTGECPAGRSIRRVKQGGAVICETDTDTTYTAGEGLDLAGTTFSLAENLDVVGDIATGGVIIGEDTAVEDQVGAIGGVGAPYEEDELFYTFGSAMVHGKNIDHEGPQVFSLVSTSHYAGLFQGNVKIAEASDGGESLFEVHGSSRLNGDLSVIGEGVVTGNLTAAPIVGKWRNSSGTSPSAIEDVPWDLEDFNSSTTHFGWMVGQAYIQIKVAGYYMITANCLRDALITGESGIVVLERDNLSGTFQEELVRAYRISAGSHLGLSVQMVGYFNVNDRVVLVDGNSSSGFIASSSSYNVISIHKLN